MANSISVAVGDRDTIWSGWASIVTVPLAASTSAGKLASGASPSVVPALPAPVWGMDVSSSPPQPAANASTAAAAKATVESLRVCLTVLLLSARGLACSPTGHRGPVAQRAPIPEGFVRPRTRRPGSSSGTDLVHEASQLRDSAGIDTGLRWLAGSPHRNPHPNVPHIGTCGGEGRYGALTTASSGCGRRLAGRMSVSPAVTPSEHAARRRTFAIISHPDAGKTTLTEKFLLYGGAVQEAGHVKARGQRRRARSDWMELEQRRGISITSAALQFPYGGRVLNLLDTPGHRDFSEDTYRVLAAVDAAVMVLDAAKGIEAQTLKLFEVCRARNVPLITFLNKWDRPGRDGLELLDEIESRLDLQPVPVTWPVGIAGDFRGLIDRRTGCFVRYGRTAHGAAEASEEVVDPSRAAAEEGGAWRAASDEAALLEEVGAEVDPYLFLAGEQTPVFVGSALTNFGVRLLLDGIVELAPPPTPRLGVDGAARKLDDPFSAFVL